ELDLNDSATFRDFSKPMGAQTSDRLDQFKKRYREWDDPHGETPPYHYGTFYSSAMIVASYLVRMEPFTQHFLKLQVWSFLCSLGRITCSLFNCSGVSLCECCITECSVYTVAGCKQNGVQLDDILLPSWAKGDPREFIRVHRMALESDYVSAHLHEWIDLIFGYKQQGQPAVEAVNVFHHLFYEGNVDIYSIDDPLKKNATIGFINNFGQIPKQLFKKPHPFKKLTNRTSVVDPGPIMPGLSYCHDKLFFHNLDNLKPSLHPLKELKGPVGQIIQHEKAVLAVEQNKVLIGPLFNRYVAWGFADYSIRMGPYESERAAFVWEDVVTVWQFDKKKMSLKQNLHGHTEAVTCLAASRPYNLIVSGSRDYTCILWDLSRLVFTRQLRGHTAPIAAVAINDLTGDLATCAGTHISLWTINGREVASVNTATGRSDRLQQILCVCFSQLNEWDNQNVIMTGSSDGVVRMWSADYVQIPVEEKKLNPSLAMTPTAVVEPSETMAERIVRKLSAVDTDEVDSFRTQHTSASVLIKCGSDSSLSEDEDSIKSYGRGLSSPPAGSGGAESGWRRGSQDRRPSLLQHSKTVVGLLSTQQHSKAASAGDPQVTKSTLTIPEDTGVAAAGADDAKGSALRISNLVLESRAALKEWDPLFLRFDMAAKDAPVPALAAASLQSPAPFSFDDAGEWLPWLHAQVLGFQWSCQLVFRSKLTMHTAFDRKDNTEPAAVTALAVSKDHKTVYVGDARGRVFTWSVTEHPGRAMADHWVRDEGGDSCLACGVRFSFAERRHHCRNCGQLFCSR
ncbi:hypothetical protein HPB47_004226, partial [Ixodes persulcatus]